MTRNTNDNDNSGIHNVRRGGWCLGRLGSWTSLPGRECHGCYLYVHQNLAAGVDDMAILEEYVYSTFVLTLSTAGLGRVNDVQSIWHGTYLDFQNLNT